MKGFIGGSLLLIALYVAVQPESSKRLESGGSIVVALFQRVLSPDVAGVPKRGSGAFTVPSEPAPQPDPPTPGPARPVLSV